ncbi:MAG: hypothetical protein IKQ60_06370 [Candidatus Methanomethylophilaceae archaeon]|jgi:methyl-accepting chemotaxis protein|nr:hypothetical protein [Candidatus Methanomethylophilaceae archaeon]
MRGIGETPEERYATLERIARALERIADAGEARNRMAEEAMRRHEAVEEIMERLEQEVSE